LPFLLNDIQNTLILIDEPEDSLHPRWQSLLIDSYQRIAEKGNNQFILATHSPYIVSSVEQGCLRIFSRDEAGNVQVSSSTERTFGKSVDQILLEVFHLDGLRTPRIEKKLKNLTNMLLDNQYESNEFKAEQQALAKILGEGDRDLALIRLEILKRRKAKANEKNQ